MYRFENHLIRDTIFPFMFGIYPYASVTKKQEIAMKEAGVEHKYQTIDELANLLSNGDMTITISVE